MHKLFILTTLTVCIGYADQPLSPLDGSEVDIIREGVKLWRDKDYLATEWPSSLEGQIFIRSSYDSCSVNVLKEGYLLVVTPTFGQWGGFSEEPALRADGFSRVEVKPFLPYKGPNLHAE